MELLVVLIIVGILASLAFGISARTRENALVKEAVANLRLMAAGERTLRMETGNFTLCATTATCNNLLRLNLTTTNYTYMVNWRSAVDFTARATRAIVVNGVRCQYTYRFSTDAITRNPASCPAP